MLNRKGKQEQAAKMQWMDTLLIFWAKFNIKPAFVQMGKGVRKLPFLCQQEMATKLRMDRNSMSLFTLKSADQFRA